MYFVRIIVYSYFILLVYILVVNKRRRIAFERFSDIMGDIRNLIARKRMAALEVKKSSLVDISCLQIKENLRLFREQQSNKRQWLTNLPRLLRQRILDKIMDSYCAYGEGDIEYFESILDAMPLLLTSETRLIATSGMMSYCPKELKDACIIKVLNLIVAHAPRVTALRLDNYDCSGCKFFPPEDMINSICKMRTLKTFKCYHVLSLQNLMTICKALGSLRYIEEVRLCLEPSWKDLLSTEEQVMSAFGHLRVLNFKTVSSNDSTQRFSGSDFQELSQAILAQQLENLESIGSYVNPCNIYVPVHCGHTTALDYNHTSKTTALRHLHIQLHEHITDVNAYRMYPSVTNLKISFYAFNGTEEALIDALAPLLQFSKVNNLVLNGLRSEESLRLILKCYGPKLKSLEILMYNRLAYLCLCSMSIFRLCPKLEHFHCDRLQISAHAMDMPRFDRLRHLTIFDINGPLVLSSFLMSPNLDFVKLFIYGTFNVAELRNVSSLVTDRKILQKINYFSLYVEARESNEYCIQLNNAGVDLVIDMYAFSPLLTYACFQFYLKE